MKKTLIAVLIVLAAALIPACGERDTGEENRARTSPYGEIIDNGELSVLCPYGWYQENAVDLASEEDGTPTDVLVFVRGVKGESPMDQMPYIRIVHFNEEEGIDAPVMSDYGDPSQVITGYSSGRYTWNGFVATTDGHTFTYIETKADEENYAVWLWMREGTEEETTVNDDDVRRILDSIQLSDEKK